MRNYTGERWGNTLTKYDIPSLIDKIIKPAGRYEQGKTEGLPYVEILSICYELNPIETMEFVIGKCENDFTEALLRYKSAVHKRGMTSEKIGEVSEMLEKIKTVEEKFGDFAKEPISDIIVEPLPLTKREELEKRFKKLSGGK